MTAPLVLGIESSCDETGVGLVRGHDLLADAVASSVDEHARFGGVVPEVASRAHLEAMVPAVRRALDVAGVDARPGRRDRGHRRAGPGRGAAGRRVRRQGVRARARQAAATGSITWPRTSPSTSSSMARCRCRRSRCWSRAGIPRCCSCADLTGDITPLGATIDDAAGEAYDKVARLLGLPFPGGPPIDAAARTGDAGSVKFPRSKYRDGTADFSFSGLKTAVARWVEAREAAGLRGAGRRRGGLVPGGGRRCADPQGGRRVPGPRGRAPRDQRRGGGQLAAAGARRRSGARRPGSGCGCRGPGCAPTTGRWSRRSARTWSPPAPSRRAPISPPTPGCR